MQFITPSYHILMVNYIFPLNQASGVQHHVGGVLEIDFLYRFLGVRVKSGLQYSTIGL